MARFASGKSGKRNDNFTSTAGTSYVPGVKIDKNGRVIGGGGGRANGGAYVH